MVLLLGFLLISLPGCEHLQISPSGSRVDGPEVPGPDATQKDVARLLARLGAALDTCNAQLPEGK